MTGDSPEAVEPDGGAGELPADPESMPDVGVGMRIQAAADDMAAFNSLLWELAKTIAIIAAMLLLVFLLVLAYLAAKWGFTTL